MSSQFSQNASTCKIGVRGFRTGWELRNPSKKVAPDPVPPPSVSKSVFYLLLPILTLQRTVSSMISQRPSAESPVSSTGSQGPSTLSFTWPVHSG
jgi:hypothetical protein